MTLIGELLVPALLELMTGSGAERPKGPVLRPAGLPARSGSVVGTPTQRLRSRRGRAAGRPSAEPEGQSGADGRPVRGRL